MRQSAGNDLPVSTPDEDRYGFTTLAENISRSIIALDGNVSTVIGIEGPWGMGKTSLLNLLMIRMQQDSPQGTHVLQISPWLSSSGGSVENLLLPVAAILNEAEEKNYCWLRRQCRKIRGSKASTLATDVVRYALQASGRLAPLAEFAGDWVPGAGIAARVMKTVSSADLSARRQTTAALRTNIERRIAALNLNFIVMLDDLDRLEPGQAVEVLRLVRSVADFSRFRYIMCYDPAVLGHAVEEGLGVADGERYLQKMVQLSFRLPRPEFFDLRREWLRGAVELFMQTNGTTPDKSVLTDLKKVGDAFGATLRTPREVKLVLGSLSFRYTPLKDYVWFPDLCLLQLLRVTEPGLYYWTEHFVTRYSSHISREGYVSSQENEGMRAQLEILLNAVPCESPLSAAELSRWLPGIASDASEKPVLFGDTPGHDSYLNDDRRLKSSDYWRYYFAFSPSKNVLSPDTLRTVFELAEDEARRQSLAAYLLDQIVDNGLTAVTWFEKILDRLTPTLISRLTSGQTSNLLWFLFNHGDQVLSRYYERNNWFAEHEVDMGGLADRLFQRLKNESHPEALRTIYQLLEKGKAVYWISVFLREQLWNNGIKGSRDIPEAQRIFSNEDILGMCKNFSRKMDTPETRQSLKQLDDLSGLIYAWQEITSPEVVKAWIKSETETDEGFLQILLRLRYRGASSVKGRYMGLDLNDAAIFFGGKDPLKERLQRIEQEGLLPDQISKVWESIANSRGT